MNVAIYLRKSRADAEAEQHGEGETLARHESVLVELARRQGHSIGYIYREIVSGETIAARPVMQQLLRAVEQGAWDGVMVMEVERLARGDTLDQGIVAQAFKYSDTRIITPSKTYDPSNEFDEEYFEFGLFMSRREYKTINRRLQAGRAASVKEGKFAGNRTPYGYTRRKLEQERGYILEPVLEQAQIVLQIFEWYVYGERQPDGSMERMGYSKIARRLTDFGIPNATGTGLWSDQTVRGILANPVYIGKLKWFGRPVKKQIRDGEIQLSRPRNGDPIITDGRHEAIVDDSVFEMAHRLLSQKKHAPSNPVGKPLMNPLAGLLVCGKCGRMMQRRPYASGYPDTVNCLNRYCDNHGSAMANVETAVINDLRRLVKQIEWDLAQRKESTDTVSVKRKSVSALEAELDTLKKQLDAAYDLLEQGIYDSDTFLERSRSISDRQKETSERLKAAREEMDQEIQRENNRSNLVPKIKNVIEVYDQIQSPSEKNGLLREVVDHIVYLKEKRGHGHENDFTLYVVPRSF